MWRPSSRNFPRTSWRKAGEGAKNLDESDKWTRLRPCGSRRKRLDCSRRSGRAGWLHAAATPSRSGGREARRSWGNEGGNRATDAGWRHGVTWRDFEVVNLPSGRPTLRLQGVAARFAEKLGVRNISLSLTHTRELGMAHVILED